MLKTIQKKFLKVVGKVSLSLMEWADGRLLAMGSKDVYPRQMIFDYPLEPTAPTISERRRSFVERLEDEMRQGCGRCPACVARKAREQNESLN